MGTIHWKFHSFWSKIHGNSLQRIYNEKCGQFVKIHFNEFEMGNMNIHGNSLPNFLTGNVSVHGILLQWICNGRCEIHENSLQMNWEMWNSCRFH